MKYLTLQIFAFSLLFISCGTAPDFDYKIVKKNLKTVGDNRSFLADLDNNFHSELIQIQRDGPDVQSLIMINNFSLDFHISSKPVYGKIYDVKASDVFGNADKEILYTYRVADSLKFCIYQPYVSNNVVIDDLIAIGTKHPDPENEWEGKFLIKEVVDLNHDGSKDLILMISAGYALYPRAIITYDVFNKSILWKYNLAGHIEEIWVKDLDKDGKYEIFCNNWSPDNGAKINEMDDKHSYFIVLDEQGNEIEKREMGGMYSSTSILFPDFGKECEEVVSITKSVDLTNENDYNIILWSYSENNVFKPLKKSKTFKPVHYTTIPYAGHTALLISDYENQLSILDQNLRVVKKANLNNKVSYFNGNYDINRDGVTEIIALGINDTTWILNNKLEILAVSEGIFRVIPLKKGRGSSLRYAFMNFKNEIYEVFLRKTTLLDRLWDNILLTIIVCMSVLLILSWVWFFLSKGNWKWYSEQLQHFNDAQTAVMLLDKKLAVQSCNKSMYKLLKSESDLSNKNGAEILTNHPVLKPIGLWITKKIKQHTNCNEHFKIEHNNTENSFHVQMLFIFSRLRRLEGILIRINDFTPIVQSQKTSAWITVAQKLAHEIKNPLTTIQLSLQRMRMEYNDIPGLKEKLSEFIENGLEEVNRLRIVIDDFMHFSKVENSHPKNFAISSIIDDLISRYRLNLPPGIEIRSIIDKDLPEINADPSHLSTVLTNLLDNAIHATKKGEITIKASFQERIVDTQDKFLKNNIEIEITDTGHGMDEETVKKIEQPFFTTKEGGSGLGISIIKKIVEEHRGEFEIFSKKGWGTRVTVRLPLNNDQN